MMLRKPSSVLHDASVQLPREYAYKVFQSLQQTDQHTRFFDASFINPADATAFEHSVRQHLNATIECCGIENFILLPPIFLRSQEDAVVHLSSQMLLVMCREGPVVPVLLFRSQPFQTQPLQEQPLKVQQIEISLQQEPHQQEPLQQEPLQQEPLQQELLQQPPYQQEPLQQPPSQQEPLQQPQDENPFQQREPESVDCVVNVHVGESSTWQQTAQVQPNKPVLTAEEERRFMEMMTKTPIAAIANLQEKGHGTLSRVEQLQRYKQMQQSIEALYSQRTQHEQVLSNPHISGTTKAVLQASLGRKCSYIQQQLAKIAAERSRLIEQQQINEVARRVLLADGDADTTWQTKIEDESTYLQTCIDVLEAANPNMSV